MENNKKIEKIPKIRQEIIEAINQNKLVLFIGAGVSALTGLPLWNSLAKEFIDICEKEGFINYDETYLINSKISDAKQKLSVAYELFKQNGREESFNSYLFDKLKVDNVDDAAKTIFEFCQWTNSPILTTNADLLLDEYFETGLVYSNLEDFDFRAHNGLFKIHGSVDNPESLVFTSEQYLMRYNKPGFISFLESVFNSDYTVLFIGYGMSEFEMLDYLVKKTGAGNKKMFYLSPFFDFESPYMTAMDLYYNSIGIELIPYSISYNGYKQLSIIIKEWKKEIDKITGIHEQKLKRLKRLFLDIKNVNQIIQLVKSENYLESRFYDLIRNSNDVEEWTSVLLKTDLFKLDKCDPKQVFFSLVFVNDVFEKIENVDLLNNLKLYTKETFEIILTNNQYAKNYSILNSFSSLLLKFPENVIGKDGVDKFIDLYISSTFNFGLLVHHINNSPAVMKWDSDSLDILCIKLIGTLETGYGNKTYWIREFAKKTYKSVLDKLTYKFFNALINWITQKEIYEKDFHFLYLGAIGEDYSKDRFGREVIFTVIEMCRQFIDSSFERIKDFSSFLDTTKQKIEEGDKHYSKTLKKLFIYLISKYFGELKGYLFNLKNNPFEQWELYGDLYLLIQKNNSAFSDVDCKLIYKWIISSTYNNKPEEYQKVIKYDFLDLLGQKHKEFDELKKNYYCENHDDYDSIFERNKPVRITSFVGVDNEDLIKELKCKNYDEIVKYLNDVKSNFEHTSYDYEDAFETIIRADPKIILNNVSDLEKLKSNYLKSVIRSFPVLKDSDEKKALETLFLIGNIVLKHQQDYYPFNEIFEQLRKYYLEDFKIEKKPVVELTVEFIEKILITTQMVFEESFVVETYDDFEMDLINNWYSIGMHFLLEAAALFQKNKIENTIIRDILTDFNAKKEGLKAVKIVLAYYFEFIFVLNKSLSKEIVDSIIDSNESIAAFLLHPFNDKTVFMRIQELGYYGFAFNEEYLFDTLRFNLTKLAVFANLMFDVNVDKEIQLVIGCEDKKSIYYLFNALLEAIESGECDIQKAKDLLDFICEELLLLDNLSSIQWYDLIMKDLSRIIMKIEGNSQLYWKVMVELSKEYNTLLSEELLECLSEYYSNKKQSVIDIVINLTKSMFYYDGKECEKLYDIIRMIKDDPNKNSSYDSINSNLIKQGIDIFVEQE